MELLKPGAAIRALLAQQAEQLGRPFPEPTAAAPRRVRTTAPRPVESETAERPAGQRVSEKPLERRLNRELADRTINRRRDQTITGQLAEQRDLDRRIGERKLDDLHRAAEQLRLVDQQRLVDQHQQLVDRIAARQSLAVAADLQLKTDLRLIEQRLGDTGANASLPRGSIIDIQA